MLVKTIVKEEREVTKEVALPYCAKENSTFYRINPDKTILVLLNYSTFKSITLNLTDSFTYNETIKKIIDLPVCDESEVLAAAEEINAVMAKRSTELVAV